MKKVIKFILVFFVIILLFFTIFYFFFFLRQPTRNIPNDTSLFVSPANGKIVNIIHTNNKNITISKENRPAFDEYISDVGTGNKTIVSIMMTPMNVHRQRSPNDAKLISQNYKEGLFLNAVKDAKNGNATYQNEHNSMLFQTSDGIRYKVIQIAGFVARRIVSKVKVGQELKQGDIIGLIKLGSQVTIVFDDNVDVISKIGDIVIDGETIIAKKK